MIASLVVDAAGSLAETALRGMKNAAEAADERGVPITWAIDVSTARSEAGEWLRKRTGDGLVLMLNTRGWTHPDDDAEARVRQRMELPQKIARERELVQKALPDADLSLAGADMKTAPLIEALETLRFTGLWGYRWNEASKRAMDRGCPFSFFYPSRERSQSGGPPSSSIAAIPRETKPLTFWRRVPPEPRAAELETEPFLKAAESVAQSQSVNAWNAVCMTFSAEACADLDEERQQALVDMWNRTAEMGFQHVALNEAVPLYRSRFPETEPTALFEKNEKSGKMELFYADARAMFIFDEENAQPAVFHNYVNPPTASPFLTETSPPELIEFTPRRSRDQLKIQFALDAHKPMPYALFLWGDYSGLRIVHENALEARKLAKYGMLLLVDLNTGENRFSLLTAI
ncbi:MAG: hypothetical protein OXT69_10400 [Candidatus Poribacteria bacterium]|nr:hypothetical protein [Candidatus Poribacteria bacterium]